MSFEQGGITFYTPDEFPDTIIYETVGFTHFIVQYSGNRLVRLNKNLVAKASHLHGSLINGGDSITLSDPGVSINSGSYVGIVVASGSTLDISGGSVRVLPAGSGKAIFCDSFVEWSSAKLKDNIEDIPITPQEAILRPRKYVLNGTPRFGFVVDDFKNRPEVVHVDEKDKGLDLMGLIAMQQRQIDDLRTRIEALEKGA